jgi:RNA polymerase sigma-70 factor (ECF subfamily)
MGNPRAAATTDREPRSGESDARVRALYDEAVGAYGPALKRIARGYEADPERRLDVLQEIHLALWQSLSRFDGRCALGTWVYRVAHNTATSVCSRRRKNAPQLVSIEDLDVAGPEPDREGQVDERRALEQLLALVQQLRPLDRQVMLLYLEDLDAQSISDVVGLSPANVATKIHRLKKVLARQLLERGQP